MHVVIPIGSVDFSLLCDGMTDNPDFNAIMTDELAFRVIPDDLIIFVIDHIEATLFDIKAMAYHAF